MQQTIGIDRKIITEASELCPSEWYVCVDLGSSPQMFCTCHWPSLLSRAFIWSHSASCTFHHPILSYWFDSGPEYQSKHASFAVTDEGLGVTVAD